MAFQRISCLVLPNSHALKRMLMIHDDSGHLFLSVSVRNPAMLFAFKFADALRKDGLQEEGR